MTDIILDEFDFGFSAVEEADLTNIDKAQELYSLINPLINNLLKDADTKPYIHWPNRKEKLIEFKTKLDKIMSAV